MLDLTDEQFQSLLNDSQGTLRELDRIEGRESLSGFVRRAWPIIEPHTPYRHNWHIDAICDHLTAVSDGEIVRLIINVPPGTSKSTLVSVMFPAWEWGPRNRPGLRYIGTSYSERYAIRDNNKTRNLVTSEWYQERWGDHVQLIKQGDKKIENMDFGFREAIPFKSLTGGRGDRVLIDDPHSTESAESEADRLKTLRIFLESVPSRVNDPEKSAIIIIMQRLHEEDVTGTALAKGLGYTHLMLPMEYDSSRHCTTYLPSGKVLFTDPRTEDGELLFPERFPRAVVERDKIPLGPYGVAGQFQQAPTPRGGGIIRWEWWKLWGNPDDSEDERFKRFPVMKFVVASFDGAFTEEKQNDYSALTIWGVFDEDGRDPDEMYVPVIPEHPLQKLVRPGERGIESRTVQNRRFTKLPKTMLMHAWQVRLPLHEVVEKIATTCNRFKVDRLLIEAKGPGISVGQEIRRLHSGEGWSTYLLDPGRLDKIARAYSVQPLFADGMVYAPDREWAELVKEQMAKLGKTAHDDLADSGTQALDHLRKIGLLRHAEEVERELTQTLTSQTRPPSKPLYDV